MNNKVICFLFSLVYAEPCFVPLKPGEIGRQKKERPAFVQRPISHPYYANMGFAEKEMYLSGMRGGVGRSVVYPGNSKSTPFLWMSMRIAGDKIYNIKIQEKGKVSCLVLYWWL